MDSSFKPIFKEYSDDCLLVEWYQSPSIELANTIASIDANLSKFEQHGIIETLPANNSLAIFYNPEIIEYDVLKILVKNSIQMDQERQFTSTTWIVPCCYDPEFGFDQTELEKRLGFSTSTLIDLHSKSLFWVNMVGFLPGFLYLSGLDPQLHLPRKSSPSRQFVPGTIAIAGSQSGIYPQKSPGGWWAIGRTPVSFFNPKNDPPVSVKISDKITFQAISKAQFDGISQALITNKNIWLRKENTMSILGSLL